jgi:hypothetical protein
MSENFVELSENIRHLEDAFLVEQNLVRGELKQLTAQVAVNERLMREVYELAVVAREVMVVGGAISRALRAVMRWWRPVAAFAAAIGAGWMAVKHFFSTGV